MSDRTRPLRVVAVLTAFALSAAVVACGDSGSSSGSAAGGGATAAKEAGGTTPTETKCGKGTGQKATGEPIKFGAIVTKVPGIDWTDGTDAAAAYFKCLNDNGGIQGRPVQFIAQESGVDPQQTASYATKLAESDNVDAFVGSFSLLDCPVNRDYYKKHGFYAIVAGVPNECFNTPNIAALNMGPGYSSLGAASYLVRKGAKSIVVVSPQQAGNKAVNELALTEAKQKGIKTVNRLETVPIADPPRSPRRSWRRPATAAGSSWTSHRRRA